MTSHKTTTEQCFDTNEHNEQYLNQLQQTPTELTAIVFGASGLVGGHCLQQLLDDKRYKKVIILVRNSLPLEHEKLEQITTDFKQLPEIPEKIDHAFCALGTTIKKAGSKDAFKEIDFKLVKSVAEYCQTLAVDYFALVSAVDASINSRFFYNKVKGEAEFAVSEIALNALAIFRPSIIVGKRKEFRLLEQVSMKIMQFLKFAFIGKLKPYTPTNAEDIAAAMIAIANLPKVASLQNIRFPNPKIKAQHFTFYNSVQIAKIAAKN